jgi:hypothetical protein
MCLQVCIMLDKLVGNKKKKQSKSVLGKFNWSPSNQFKVYSSPPQFSSSQCFHFLDLTLKFSRTASYRWLDSAHTYFDFQTEVRCVRRQYSGLSLDSLLQFNFWLCVALQWVGQLVHGG